MEQCPQNVADVGVAANNNQQLLRNLQALFAFIDKAGLKLTLAKCHIRVRQLNLLGRTITQQGMTIQKHKITKFLEEVNFLRSKKLNNDALDF